ncbi:hypothetical protein GCM10010260_55260 [Streptomyces filipinensis]|uniref:Lipoprotein n=1 Tax=Streptomyces filipinensis TaxID=66887 RepID=A0A918IF46_9ACTN|nr:hypothetical protein [Streptomyces filipinensis]GGV09760.1 hypothetical protein GCM10010260_55260 [Streptomyces filipinensis]
MTRPCRLLAALALVLTAGCTGGAGSSPAAPGPSPSTAVPSPSTPHASPARPGEGGFPDAGTTGPRIPLAPHSTGDISVRTDGTVIRGWDITGSLDIYANDVTIIDSRITSANWWGVNLRPGHSGLRVLHTTITAVPGKGPDNGGVDYAVSNMGTSSVEVGWCDISVFGNALSMGQGHLHDNYVHDLVPFRNNGGEWQHTDAVISGGGGKGKLVIRHNTLLNSVAVDRGASAAVGLFADTGHVSDTVIDDNLLAGGAYALYGGGDGATGIRVTNNVFSTRYHRNSGGYGAVTAWNSGGSGNVWRGNRFSDGTPIAPEPAG